MKTTSTGVHLGIIGMGAMGRPMAEHFLRAHGAVSFVSSQLHEDLVAQGALARADAVEMARDCDGIVVMVPDLPDLERYEADLMAGARERAEDSAALLVMIGSTVSAVGVRELQERFHAAHAPINVSDTPVSGGPDGALAATLSIMVGGTDEDAARACEFLAPCGTAVHLGPLGAGQVAKACNQLVVTSTMFALGEASVMAERSGIDLRLMWDLLDGGYAGSNLLDTRKERLITDDDSPAGMLKYLQKDVGLGMAVAESVGMSPGVLPALQALLHEAVDEKGLGDRDMSVTKRFFKQR